MADETEASFGATYRDARKTFIAEVTRAHADDIARVHPRCLGPDGKPLFIDSTVLGPREANKAVLVITGSDGQSALLGSQFLIALLKSRVVPRPGTKLIVVHALNPYGFAWGSRENEDGLSLDDPKASQSWSLNMLRAIAIEDLAKIQSLRLLEVAGGANRVADGSFHGPARVLKAQRPAMLLRAARIYLRPALAKASAKPLVTSALATL